MKAEQMSMLQKCGEKTGKNLIEKLKDWYAKP